MVIFSRVSLLADWTLGEVIILTSFSNIGWALYNMFLEGFYSASDKVISGDRLERYLTKPVNALFAILFEDVNPLNGLTQLLIGVFIMILAVQFYQINIKPMSILISFLVLLIGWLTLSLIYGTVQFLSFWTGRTKGVMRFLVAFDEYTLYPLDKIDRSVKFFLTWGIPIIFLSTHPTLILVGKLDIYNSLNVLLTVSLLFVVWLIIFQFCWHMGLKRYESYGG